MNNDNDPWAISAEARRAAREAKIGDACPCGEDDVAALIVADLEDKRVRAYFEKHHPFGWAHDPDTVLAICLNCHRKLHYDLPQSLFQAARSPAEQMLKVWYIIAALLQFIGRTMRQLADRLFPEAEHGTA